MKLYFLISFFSLSFLSYAQVYDKSKINKERNYSALEVVDTNISVGSAMIGSRINQKTKRFNSDNFSFIVSGHFHGASNSASGMPAASLMANLNAINKMNPAFMVCLGDLFLNVERDYLNYEKYFFNELEMPLFNSVGNHDVDNDFYEVKYGKTFSYFNVGENTFIILNTELNNGDIKGEQLKMLSSALNENPKAKNIFIFMHRTLWVDLDDNLAKLFHDNTQSTLETNFKSEIYPLIKKAAQKSNVILMSGSLGNAPASFFYHPYEKNITFAATAIRDLPRDAVLIVRSINNKISYETFSLNSNKVLPFENYTYEWWINHRPQEPGFNWRLVPLYIWQMITHRYFWYGVGSFTLGFIFIYLIVRFKKRKSAKKI